jgi:PKD repeat protein
MKKSYILLMAIFLNVLHVLSQENINTLNEYILDRKFDIHGKEVVAIIVPGKPPDNHHEPIAIPSRSAVNLTYVPAFDWSFGCSATAAAMAAGYYDNNGYPDMYTGPTNGGIMPMDNSSWGIVEINGEIRAQCPLSATRNTVDGRTTRGHVNDYWVQYGSTSDDPYIINGWTAHTYGDCTGDFMGTNQSALGSSDGSTTFYNYIDGSPLYNYTDCEPGSIDGCHGLRDFYESRGYGVIQNYSQYIYGYQGNTLGFTFNQFKQEIDNGRPVLIQLAGHTVLGYGYDDTGTIVYLHDTWDYSNHSMVWGTSYSGLEHYGVCVVQLEPSTVGIMANFEAGTTTPLINITVSFTDLSYGNPTNWSWSITPGTFIYAGETSASSQNPQVQFTAGGSYTVTLIASNSTYEDSETKTNYIQVTDCSVITLPFTEDFSDGELPACWLNIDNQGNGQVWQFNNPGSRTVNTTTADNGFAILDSDHYGDGNSQDADLITPVLNLSEYTNVIISFQHYFKEWSGSSATLSYSINNGSSWNVIQTWDAETANAESFNQNVSAQVAGQSNVRFKWNYSGAWGYYWAVDDISITGSVPGLWTGATSTDWNTASNWSDGMVPVSTTNVSISPNSIYWPLFSGNFTIGSQCCSMTIPAGSEMAVAGNFTINQGCWLTFSGVGELKISGDWTNNGTLSPGPGTINFFGTTTSTVNPPQSTINNYSRVTFTKGMTALTGATTSTATGDDASQVIPINFTFNYGGTGYTNARICTNGWLSLDQSGAASNNNTYLFSASVPNTTLAPWFDDIADDGTSKLYYKTEGASPYRVFTVEWNKVKTYSTVATARISFQVKLFETTNVIEFHYGNVETGTYSTYESGSIGIEDATGGSGHFIEATTGSTTTGILNLKCSANWPAVNYRFTPPIPLQTFQKIKISKTSANVDFNTNIIINGCLDLMPGATFIVKNGKTMTVQGLE